MVESISRIRARGTKGLPRPRGTKALLQASAARPHLAGRTRGRNLYAASSAGFASDTSSTGRVAGGSSVSPTDPAAQTAHDLLRSLSTMGLPCFPVASSGSVRVLCEPAELYDELLRGARTARRRVGLASLYLGNGPSEAALVDALTASQDAVPQRELSVVVDGHRAQRRGGLALLSRVARSPGAQVSLVTSPASPRTSSACKGTPGLPRIALPGVLSEVRGVQHAKLAIFDDDVLLTGANLSDEYFTNRQDRYVLFAGVPHLADFLSRILALLANHGDRLHALDPPDHKLPLPPRSAAAAANGAVSLAADVRAAFLEAHATFPPPSAAEVARGGSWLVPMVQIGAAGLVQESDAVQMLLSTAVQSRPALPLLLSSPYLNPPQAYADRLCAQPPEQRVGSSHASMATAKTACVPSRPGESSVPQPSRPQGLPPDVPTLLSAAPSASGFWKAGGAKGYIPHVYAALEHQLAGTARSRAAKLRLLHFARERWTYHAKGLWLWPAAARDAGGPILSLLGSTNLSERSTRRDIELSVCLVATEPGVREQLHEEQARLRAFSREATLKRPTALARLLALLLRTFF